MASVVTVGDLLATGQLSTVPPNCTLDDQVRVATENPWFPLITDHRHRLKIFHGGRGGGKTHAFASAIPRLMDRNDWPTGEPLRVVVMREKLKSIEKSCKATIEQKIHYHLGLSAQFRGSTKTEIKHQNGAQCFFYGMSNVTEESVRGLESIDILWFEEAQAMSRRSWEILEPTIRRDHSEIWVSFNPERRTDPVWDLKEYYEQFPRKNVLVFQTNFDRNVFFTENNNQSRLHMKRTNPERYKYVWLGEPDDGVSARKLLPHGDLLKVMKKYDSTGYVYAGFDVADKGSDFNALVIRQGPYILFHERWTGKASTIQKSVRRVVTHCTNFGVDKLYFDETGLGAGVGGALLDIKPGFKFEGINFGQRPANPRKIWGMQGQRAVKQNDRYAYRTGQMADTLRMRLHASLASLRGDKEIDPDACLWINPDIKDRRKLLVNMSQPEENETVGGKMLVEKQPKPEGSTSEPPSPDGYDAALLAFATDSAFGVKRVRWVT